MKKKLLSLLMALCLVVTLLPVNALAVGGTPQEIDDEKELRQALYNAPVDGTQALKTYAAVVGNENYESLEDALSALNGTNHTLTLIDESKWAAGKPVYWKVGDSWTAADTLANALTGAYMANDGTKDITIVCRPDTDVGAMTHGHVADNLTIYGNSAWISGGECDLEVDQYKFSRETGKEDKENGKYLEKDIIITAYEMDNLGVWGTRNTEYTLTVNLIDCDGKAIADQDNVQRVYLNGTSGTNNITLTGCDFITKNCPVYSNAPGTISLEYCTFTGVKEPINLNNKGAIGTTQEISVRNCTFTDCSTTDICTDDATWAAPIRIVSSKGAVSNLTVNSCDFVYSTGKTTCNGDILLGDGREGKDKTSYPVYANISGTKAEVQIQKPGDRTSSDNKSTVIQVTSSEQAALSNVVAKIGEVEYTSLADAIKAAGQMSGNVTITLLGDVDVSDPSARTYDLSASTSLTGLTIRGASQDVQIISGVDGNDIDGPSRCPVLTVKLPANAVLTVEDLTFPNDLLFDTQEGGTLVVQNCVFNGAQSGYPQADKISYLNNIFEFKGTASNFYTNNAYAVWYKEDGSLDFKFTGNTVIGYRGVHIETRGSEENPAQVDIQVDNNHFQLSDSTYSNKTVALQLVNRLNGSMSFKNNYVDAYMAVCFYNGIKRIDGSLDIQNNQLTSGCKLYGSSEWNALGATETEKEAAADAFAKDFVSKIPTDDKTISAGHTEHHYVNGVCTICGEKKPVPVEPSEPSTPVGDYLVSVDKTTGGKVTVNPGRADKGDTVTITVRPDKGYELDELTVTAKNGDTVKLTEKSNGKFTFKMPDSKVTVEAVFVKEDSEKPVVTLPFADVNKGDWFYDAVAYVYGNDLMNGTSATAFSPYLTTSRAMMLTMLARYDGVDTTAGSTWYEAGAVWAVSKGISDGTNLEADLTREQLVTMLWRYAGSPVVESGLSGYPDGAAVSDWAVNAMIWATGEGVITGNGAGALNPQGTATRAEVATILARFCAMER